MILENLYPYLVLGAFASTASACVALLWLLSRVNVTDKRLWLLWLSLVLLVTTSLSLDLVWIVIILRKLLHVSISKEFAFFLARILRPSVILQYFSMGFLFTKLPKKHVKLDAYNYLAIGIISLYFLYSLFMAIADYGATSFSGTEARVRTYLTLGFLLIFVVATVISSWRKLNKLRLPQILTKQYGMSLLFIAVPYIIWQFTYYTGIYNSVFRLDQYSGSAFGQIVVVTAVFFVLKNIMRLRFLNAHKHVQSAERFKMMNRFRDVLEALSKVSVAKELNIVTQDFFRKNLRIPRGSVRLYIRPMGTHMRKAKEDPEAMSAIEKIIEGYLGSIESYEEEVDYVKKHRILNYHEIEFDNFYGESNLTHNLLNFLELIEAEIFIPIVYERELVAYIIIERNSRPDELYTDVERDEMIVYASYLAQIVHFLQNHNFKQMLMKQKEYEQNLYEKHLKITQFQESIQTFLEPAEDDRIGIMFYKNKRFTAGNHQATELVNIDLNVAERHPITQAFYKILSRLDYNRSPYSDTVQDAEGNPLYITGIPGADEQNVIFIVHRPSVAEVVHKRTAELADRNDWDYVIALETTKNGQLINKLYPGTSKHLLTFKASLLKLALSKKAIMLELAEADTLPTVEIIHHISLRTNLQILELNEETDQTDVAVKLFGINPIFGQEYGTALFEQLDKTGTLLIKNIELLSHDIQKQLLEYIKYGTYTILRSDKKILSDVRVILSTTKNLHKMVLEGKIIPSLYEELNQSAASLPTLLSLPEKELSQLIDQLTKQAVKRGEYQDLFELTHRERSRLLAEMPVSLTELKSKIEQIMRHKSEENKIALKYTSMDDTAIDNEDPVLIQASHMGKRALRDPAMMSALWERFKNQNKIATFLGVNRSSVSRRCREYNLDQ